MRGKRKIFDVNVSEIVACVMNTNNMKKAFARAHERKVKRF